MADRCEGARRSANRSPRRRSGQWLKKPGEAVQADEPIASLETDKVSVEVPSPVAGVLGEQLVEEGDTVEVGAVIARIDENAAAAAAPASRACADAPQPTRPHQPGRRRRKCRRCAATRMRPTADASPDDRRRCRAHASRPRCAARCSNIMSIRRSDQGHRQGRPADQGRRPRRRQGAGSRGPGASRPTAAPRRPAAAPPPAAGRRRHRRPPRGARQDDAPSPDDRHAAQGGAEHRRDADDVQRRRHDAR